MRRIFYIILIYLLSFPTLAVSGAGTDQAVGAVAAWQGDVLVYHDGADRGVNVKALDSIYPNDIIATGLKSRAKILLDDDTIISIGENTRFAIEGGLADTSNRKRVSGTKLISGTVRILSGIKDNGQQSEITLETANSVVGLNGSDLIASISQRGDEFVSLSGDIVLNGINATRDKEVRLTAGKTSLVANGRYPDLPDIIPPGRLNELLSGTSISVVNTSTLVQTGCVQCHQEVYSSILKSTVPHAPSYECSTCHIRDPERLEPRSISGFSTENLIILPLRDKSSYRIKVRPKAGEGAQARPYELIVHTSNIKENIPDNRRLPTVSTPRIEEVGDGAFVRTVLSFATDEPSTSHIEYGKGVNMGSITSGDEVYSREHRVSVSGLNFGETYYMRAVSRDMYDNVGRSDIVKLRIEKKKTGFKPQSDGKSRIINVKAMKAGTRTAVLVETSSKAPSVVEVEEIVGTTETGNKEPHYPGLVSLRAASAEGCSNLKCHKTNAHKKRSHPMERLNWEYVNVPDFLPIQNRAMICVTCHFPHGSKNEFLLRKKANELCLACHAEKS